MATTTNRSRSALKEPSLFVDPRTWMTAGWLSRNWPVAWLRQAAREVGIDTTGTKKDLVVRIAGKISKGDTKVIRRFDRCC